MTFDLGNESNSISRFRFLLSNSLFINTSRQSKMPSRESVPGTVRARMEFSTAVRTGIHALMSRCGYSRERAISALLKELNRGCGTDCKPTDDEVFDTMRRYDLGLDEATTALVVSRAMRRELLAHDDKKKNRKITPLEAIQRLTCKLSLDNILYESGEDDSDDDGQNEILPLKIPMLRGVPSTSSKNVSSSSSTTSNTTSNRKNTRSKKTTTTSPRKQQKTNHIRNKTNSNNNNNTILVGRKRSIEDMDPTTKQNAGVDARTAATRPQLRASKRLHRSSTVTEPVVASGLNADK